MSDERTDHPQEPVGPVPDAEAAEQPSEGSSHEPSVEPQSALEALGEVAEAAAEEMCPPDADGEVCEPTSGLERHKRLAEDTPRGGAFTRLISNPPFRRLWIAQFVSGIGDWLVIGLLMPIVYRLSGGSSFAVAGIVIAKIIPALLLSSFTGVLVDRYDRRKVMITADLARSVLCLPLLFTNSLGFIYLIVLLMETASLFFYPARNALIPYLVDEDDVAAANGLAYTTQQGSMLIGLLATGAILAAFEAIVRQVLSLNLPIVTRMVGLAAPALLGPRAGVALDSLTFLFSAAMVATIHVTAKAAHAGEGRLDLSLVGRDVRESFQFLGQHQELSGLLKVIFLAILGGGSIIAVAPAYVATLSELATSSIPLADQIPGVAQLIGTPQTFMLVFLALGMVVGALVAPRLEEHMSLQLMFAGSVTAFGTMLVLFAFITFYALVSVFAFAAGFCVAMVTVAGNTYVVRTVDDSIRGRVFTALESVIRVALLASMVVMAPIGDLITRLLGGLVGGARVVVTDFFADPKLAGERVTLIVSGLVVLGAAVYAWRTLSWRNGARHVAEEGLADA